MKIGVIGNGFVGNAVAQYFKTRLPTVVWDKDETRCTGTFQEVMESDFVFLCLPSPTFEDGSQDLTALYETVDVINLTTPKSILILKSTVLPGTTQSLAEKYPNLNFVFNPEFLTARTAVQDFANPSDIVLGGHDECLQDVSKLYSTYFPQTPILLYDFTTAEMIKYARNTFYAVKVAYFNEIYMICQTLGIDYKQVREGVLASGWVNPMHTLVPGPDGKLGFGGACLPKDSKALVRFGKSKALDMFVLSAALDTSKKLRKD
jgi:UDPglucose 6-dehydrogenase